MGKNDSDRFEEWKNEGMREEMNDWKIYVCIIRIIVIYNTTQTPYVNTIHFNTSHQLQTQNRIPPELDTIPNPTIKTYTPQPSNTLPT